MKIRKATLEDLKRIQELNLMLFTKEHEEFDGLLDLDWTFGERGESYFRESLTKKDHCAFVAEEDEKIIGYLTGGLATGEDFRKLPKMAELESIFVLEEYRLKGIGKKLYLELVKWAKENDVKRMKVQADPRNEKGISYYEKMGFKGATIVLEGSI